MSACNCCEQPVWGVVGFTQPGGGDSGDESSAGAAWGAAVADVSYDSSARDSAVNDGAGFAASGQGEIHGLIPNLFDPDEVVWSASARPLKWWFRFYTATCYIKLFWDYITFQPEDTEISRSAQTWQWTPTGDDGLCLPAVAVLLPQGYPVTGAEDDWPISEIFEITNAMVRPPDPDPPTGEGGEDTSATVQRVSVENLRFSLVPGWEPEMGQGPFPE